MPGGKDHPVAKGGFRGEISVKRDQQEDQVMKEMRQFPRLDVPHQIELIYCDRCYRGRLENLSVNGALVQLQDLVEIPTGRGCELRIDLSSEGEGSSPLLLGAETIHGAPPLVGMRFTRCDQDLSILELLVQLLAAQPDRLGHDLARIRGYLADYQLKIKTG